MKKTEAIWIVMLLSIVVIIVTGLLQPHIVEKKLIQAVRNNDTDIALWLIKLGADPNYRNDDEGNAFINAAIYGNTEVIDALIAKNTELNLLSRYGTSALLSAAGGGHTDLVFKLLEYGVDKADNSGYTALHVAAFIGHTSLMRLLLEKNIYEVDQVNNIGETPLMSASLYGNIVSAKMLIVSGADVNAVDIGGESVLIKNAKHTSSNAELVRLFVNEGSPIDLKDADGKTALMFASETGCLETVQVFVEEGADVNDTDRDGKTALMYASETLNKNTYIPNEQDELSSYSPEDNYLKIIKTLVDNGADVNIQDINGRKAIDIASENGNELIIKYLTEVGAKE